MILSLVSQKGGSGKSTLAAAICTMSALATSATRAEAYAEEVFGKSGPFIIHRIFEGKKTVLFAGGEEPRERGWRFEGADQVPREYVESLGASCIHECCFVIEVAIDRSRRNTDAPRYFS